MTTQTKIQRLEATPFILENELRHLQCWLGGLWVLSLAYGTLVTNASTDFDCYRRFKLQMMKKIQELIHWNRSPGREKQSLKLLCSTELFQGITVYPPQLVRWTFNSPYVQHLVSASSDSSLPSFNNYIGRDTQCIPVKPVTHLHFGGDIDEHKILSRTQISLWRAGANRSYFHTSLAHIFGDTFGLPENLNHRDSF